MPRKEKVDTSKMSPAQYMKMFGRKKPGPAPGAKKAKVIAKAGKAKVKADGTAKKKPGPKPGFKKTKAHLNGVKPKAAKTKGVRLKKDGTPWGKPGPKAGFKAKGAAPKAEKKVRLKKDGTPWGTRGSKTGSVKASPEKPVRLKKDGTPWGKRGGAKQATSIEAKPVPEKPIRLKKDGTPWGKAGPKKTKDLGTPPPRKVAATGDGSYTPPVDVGELAQKVLDLPDEDQKMLLRLVCEKLEGDTSKFGDAEWESVKGLIEGPDGIQRYEAVQAVRRDLEIDEKIDNTAKMEAAPFPADDEDQAGESEKDEPEKDETEPDPGIESTGEDDEDDVEGDIEGEDDIATDGIENERPSPPVGGFPA